MSLPLGTPPSPLPIQNHRRLPPVSIILPSSRRCPSPRNTAGSLVAPRDFADLHLLMERVRIKRPLLFDDSGDARRRRMAEEPEGASDRSLRRRGSAVICVDSSRRRAASIIAVWPRQMRTEGDRPAGGGRSRCWPALRYKGGSRAV